MISNRLKTYGLKSSQTSMAHKITDIMVNHLSAHLQTSSKTYIVMQSNSSINIKWWCSKNNKMNFSNKLLVDIASHKVALVAQIQIKQTNLRKLLLSQLILKKLTLKTRAPHPLT